MGLILLEALGALLLLVGIVWWTMFSGRKRGELVVPPAADGLQAQPPAAAPAVDGALPAAAPAPPASAPAPPPPGQP